MVSSHVLTVGAVSLEPLALGLYIHAEALEGGKFQLSIMIAFQVIIPSC